MGDATVTNRQYRELERAQNRSCAICTKHKGAAGRLVVDDHPATGRVRGLLCPPCYELVTYLAGRLDACADWPQRTAAYLRDHGGPGDAEDTRRDGSGGHAEARPGFPHPVLVPF